MNIKRKEMEIKTIIDNKRLIDMEIRTIKTKDKKKINRKHDIDNCKGGK